MTDIKLPDGWPVKRGWSPWSHGADMLAYNQAIDECTAAYLLEKQKTCKWTYDSAVAEWERKHYHPECKDTREYELPGEFCPHCSYKIEVVK